MGIVHVELLIIAILAAIACALPGIFLLLRGMALMSDAISHAILLGIVVMFLWVQKLNSPFLLLGAAVAGLATVWCTEQLIQSGKVKKETAIGLIFPLFFSVAIILITLFARNVHLDADMVLLGDIAFAPFQRISIGGFDIGPYAFWQLLSIVMLNGGLIFLFYKELLLITFNQEFGMVTGFSPLIIHYLIMSMASITAVAAFDVVGAIVVVALMITPAAGAFLLSSRLSTMILLTLFFSAISALIGWISAIAFDVSITGSIATATGLVFAISMGIYLSNGTKVF